MSMAVRRVCRRDGTKTSAGLVGECFMMEWYTGLAMDSRRVWVWLTLKPYQEEEDVQKKHSHHVLHCRFWACFSVGVSG